jgi:hypothetical protein
VPHTDASCEPRNVRLLKLALLQIAILTTATACADGDFCGHEDPNAPVQEQPAAPSAVSNARFANAVRPDMSHFPQ